MTDEGGRIKGDEPPRLPWQTTRLPAASCPQCSCVLDAGTMFTGSRPPRSGDFSLCAYCGCALRFDAYSWSFVRRASPSELSDLAREQPDTYREFRRAQTLIRRQRGGRRRRH